MENTFEENKNILSQEETEANKLLKDKLLGLLDYISDLFKKNDIPFWLTCGTLLGAVRTGKFIPWDIDIDIAIWKSDVHKLVNLEPTILSDGYLVLNSYRESVSIVRQRYEDWGFIEDWISHEDPQLHQIKLPTGEHLCIRYTITNGKMAFNVWYPFDRCPNDNLQNLGEIEFEGKMYPCPRNPERSLRCNYGEDWEIPKLEWYMIERLPGDVLKKYADIICLDKRIPENLEKWL